MIRVLVADDHPIVRAGLARVLGGLDDIDVVGTADSGESAVAVAAQVHPDVILMDPSMPGMGGVAAVRQIMSARPGTRVVMVASTHDDQAVLDAFDAGAIGYLLKDAEPGALVAAVRDAAGGGSPVDAKAATALVRERADRQHAVVLSAREVEILRLVDQGLLNKQIARALGIGEKTVKAHLGRVYQRLGVQGRREAVLWGRRNGALPDGPAVAEGSRDDGS